MFSTHNLLPTFSLDKTAENTAEGFNSENEKHKSLFILLSGVIDKLKQVDTGTSRQIQRGSEGEARATKEKVLKPPWRWETKDYAHDETPETLKFSLKNNKIHSYVRFNDRKITQLKKKKN